LTKSVSTIFNFSMIKKTTESRRLIVSIIDTYSYNDRWRWM